jgi:HlyD family secretion protein
MAAEDSLRQRLDRPFAVVDVSDWLPLGTVGLIVIVVVAWSVIGRVPITVAGRTALIFPRTMAGASQVEPFDAPASGVVVDLRVNRGDAVTRGQLIAIIDQPELREDLEIARREVQQIHLEHATLDPMEAKQRSFELKAIASKQARIRASLAKTADPAVIQDLRAELAELDNKEQLLAIGAQKDRISFERSANEAANKVEALEHRLRVESLVVTDSAGTVLEVDAVVGQSVSRGSHLGFVQLPEAGDRKGLQAVAYFTLADGKRMQPGMKMQVTPVTVKRSEYGGITGTVSHVSAFAVTKQSATNLVGSDTVAEELMGKDRVIEVIADLDTDPSNPSGYSWSSSRGPLTRVSAGTTGAMQVKIEDRAPISLFLPILRSGSGL